MNGDPSPERYEGYRNRHRDRLLLFHALQIEMRVIRRLQLDDPRLTEPEMRTRLYKYTLNRERRRQRADK